MSFVAPVSIVDAEEGADECHCLAEGNKHRRMYLSGGRDYEAGYE